jgi:hypothetical protein
MADIQTSAADKKEKEFFTDVPQEAPGFFLKGCHQYDWGLKNRLAKVFNPKDGRTVMLAFDHGYFQGPTTGLHHQGHRSARLRRHLDDQSHGRVGRRNRRQEGQVCPPRL